ncbi:MAG: hypothetical protein SPL52_16430, partial [Fibrobacter sp.]|nr:hypothetical protein [Fibrobacter sp.]
VKNQYTIVATIAEVKDGGKVLLNGAGKYAYAKDEKTKWLVLEGDTAETTKLVENVELVANVNDETLKNILATAMINKKPLKLTVEGDSPFTIISIKNP